MGAKRLQMEALGLILFLAMCLDNAHASPVYFSVTDHYYEAIYMEGGITWTDAHISAQAMSYSGIAGHLATITSVEENNFVIGNLNFVGYWLGGIQPVGSAEPGGGWQWVTGEPWSYVNWFTGEPNNTYGGDQGVHPYGWPEDALQFVSWESSGKWNDFAHDIPMTGYIVEYGTQPSSPVPEPATVLLLASGLAGLAGFRRKLRK